MGGWIVGGEEICSTSGIMDQFTSIHQLEMNKNNFHASKKKLNKKKKERQKSV